MTLSQPAHASIHMYCTLFPSGRHFTYFTIYHLYVEIHFYTADGLGPYHWPLVPGRGRNLVVRIQHSHRLCLTSVSGWELKPCFKLPQAKAT